MSAFYLTVCDPDIRYSKQLHRYLEERADFPCRVRLFSSPALCREALEKEPADLLLLAAAFAAELRQSFPAKEVVLLGDATRISSTLPVIDRYRPAAQVCQDLFLLIAPGRQRSADAGEAEILSVYAPCGACLKTSLSLLLAELIGREQSCLYLNLEDVGTKIVTAEAGGKELPDLLYYLQQDRALAQTCLSRARKSSGHFTFLPAPQSAFDLYETPESSWLDLFSFLLDEAAYSCLVLDLGSGLGKLPFFLSQSARIFLPAKKERRAAQKLESFTSALPQLVGPAVAKRVRVVDLPGEALAASQTADISALLASPLAEITRNILR